MPLAGKNVFDFLISVITTTIHYDSVFCVSMFVFSVNKRTLKLGTRVARSIARKHLIVTIFSYKSWKKWKENSIISRGTGSNMNAKLIKGWKITRMTGGEQRFEPIVKKSAMRFFHEVRIRPSPISYNCLHCLQLCFWSWKINFR